MCSAVAPSFWWYFVFRVFTGATVAGIISTSALLAVEPVGPNYRGTAILSTGMPPLTSYTSVCQGFVLHLWPEKRGQSYCEAAQQHWVICEVWHGFLKMVRCEGAQHPCLLYLAIDLPCLPHRSWELLWRMPALAVGMASAFLESADLCNLSRCGIGSLCCSASAARVTKMAPQ